MHACHDTDYTSEQELAYQVVRLIEALGLLILPLRLPLLPNGENLKGHMLASGLMARRLRSTVSFQHSGMLRMDERYAMMHDALDECHAALATCATLVQTLQALQAHQESPL